VKRAGAILLAVVAALALGLFVTALHYRVVRTPWGTVLLEKPRPTLSDTYVDTRKWDARDFAKNWEISKQLMRRGLETLDERNKR
jgi:hypothetical protein